MSDSIGQNEMQRMLDRAVDRLESDLGNKLANLEDRVNQTQQDVLHIRDQLARFMDQIESQNRATNQTENTFRM